MFSNEITIEIKGDQARRIPFMGHEHDVGIIRKIKIKRDHPDSIRSDCSIRIKYYRETSSRWFINIREEQLAYFTAQENVKDLEFVITRSNSAIIRVQGFATAYVTMTYETFPEPPEDRQESVIPDPILIDSPDQTSSDTDSEEEDEGINVERIPEDIKLLPISNPIQRQITSKPKQPRKQSSEQKQEAYYELEQRLKARGEIEINAIEEIRNKLSHIKDQNERIKTLLTDYVFNYQDAETRDLRMIWAGCWIHPDDENVIVMNSGRVHRVAMTTRQDAVKYFTDKGFNAITNKKKSDIKQLLRLLHILHISDWGWVLYTKN